MAGPGRGRSGVLGRGGAILWLAIRAEPRLFAVSIIGSSLFTLMGVASSLVLGDATQHVVIPSIRDRRADWSALVTTAVALAAVGLTRAAGMYLRRLAGGSVVFRSQARYRALVTRQYLRLPLSWHQRHSTGTLLSNANADVEAAWAPLMGLPLAVGALIMLVVALILLVVTDPVLALIGFVVFPAFGVVNVLYSRRVWPLYSRAQAIRGEVSSVAHESFDGALVVKTLGREQDETDRFAARAGELRDAMIRAGRARGMFDPLMEALPNLGILLVLLVGAMRIQAGAMDVGQLVRVAYLFTLLAFPLRAFGWVFGDIPRSVVGFGRVEAVLTARGQQEFGPAVLTGSGPAGLVVDRVGYHYPRPAAGDVPPPAGPVGPAGSAGPDASVGSGESVPVGTLDGVSFAVAPGRVTAIVGRTGAGKSTLVSLLARLVDPVTGTVRLDGVDLRELAAGEVTRSVALVSQQAFLFDDTVRANVTLGADLPDGAVWAALRGAQADGFVAALPDGLDTMVGERGTSLSGGQRQRIGLARALVRAPRLLVLDDATASVDPRVEAAILAGLRARAGESTVVVVAHRRSTIALADQVVHLDGGRVIGQGRHEDLLAGSPRYAALLTAYEQTARAEGAAPIDPPAADTRAAGTPDTPDIPDIPDTRATDEVPH